ncbi:MAG: hypothetical protein COW03_00745 [Cytophagales bacterium CG12_big_fil_rev_8_21_14_0_65_40_12]|nr:MAG: hypothetical protein COW03_00745 [Cytophagales bacterium CG12_big_fil_rev_8_21_14_0_65_40_12]PIW05384.1 MAG: hypothetical protein COW40_04760 [Cytophagales bacterium CG17_big_fil_post_rev_8_21_14_2_50_40_13]
MLKKPFQIVKIRKAFAIGFLSIFILAFFTQAMVVSKSYDLQELVDAGEENEKETENSKEWNDDFITSNFSFHVLKMNVLLTYQNHVYTEFGQLMSIFSPPPDLI